MKTHGSMLRIKWHANILRRQPGLASAAGRPGFRQRISSRWTQWIVLLTTLGALVAISVVLKTRMFAGKMPWVWSVLGITSALAAVVPFVAWKQVWRGERHYMVSNLFKSEVISFDDVCLVVEARGLIWNTVRVHFKRPTRFGWDVNFVPARSVGTSCTLAAAWRTRRLVK